MADDAQKKKIIVQLNCTLEVGHSVLKNKQHIVSKILLPFGNNYSYMQKEKRDIPFATVSVLT